ncbi:MAG TPA: M48 family metalloprotease [Pyrinomonadaceae bacterium]|nr:M48 family metalloprotease [Pyrinomonadaceae bacterium]
MNRRQFSHRLLCLLVSLLFIAQAAAAAPADDEGGDDSLRNFASLTVRLDSKGSAHVFLSWGSDEPFPPALEQRLNELLGVRLQRLSPEGVGGYEDYEEQMPAEDWWQAFYGRADNALPRSGLLVSGRLNLAPLAQELRALGVTQLGVMVVLPQASEFNSFTGLKQCTPQIKFYLCTQLDLAADSPALIDFSYGYRLADVLWKWVPLALFLLVPALLTLRARRQALRARETDPAASWFGYFRFLNLAVLGMWLLWLPLYAWVNPDEIFRYMAESNLTEVFLEFRESRVALPFGFEILKLVLYFLPPVLATVLCHLLSHKVFTRVRGMEWSPAEVVRQALWAQASFLVPIFFLLLGLTSVSRNPSVSAACFILAFVSWQVCARLSSKAQKFTPQALTTGGLRDRIFELAARAGVPLKQIYILPEGKGRAANAFARSDNTILLTDSLPRHLTEREVATVVAHELAHLKERHPRTLGIVFMVTVAAAAFVTPALASAASLERWQPALYSVAIAAAMMVTHYVSRGYERHADALAITLTRDPEAFITALAKLARLNVLPVHWGTWDDAWSTHPSTEHRVRRLAEYGGVTPERLQELLEAARSEPLPDTPLPAETIETGKVFSTAFKAGVAQRVSWTIIAVVTCAPLLLAWLVVRWQPAGAAKWLAYAGGVAASYAFYQFVKNYVALWGHKALREGLSAKLKRAGFEPEEGTFAGFAPASGPRIYENNYIWDAGFLFLTDEQLCYVGEETRFALRREQVEAIYLGDGPADWPRRPPVYVRWRDAESNSGGTFYLTHGEVRSLWQARRKASALCDQLHSWRWRGSVHPAASRQLAQLSAPAHGPVTSVSPAEFFSTAKFISSTIMLSLFTLVLGVAFRLHPAMLLYALIVTVSVCLIDRIPHLLRQARKTEGSPGPPSYQQGTWAETET